MEQLYKKLYSTFEKEIGHTPTTAPTVKDGIVFCDGYSCILINGHKVKRTHGLVWRLDTL